MNIIEENNKVQMITQSTTTVVLSSYFSSAYIAMLPWLIAAIPLIIVDLRMGRKKARLRGEEVTFNKSARMTLDKSCSYICWVMLSTSLSMAFNAEWIKIAIMAIVYGLEVVSAVKSWLITKGYDIDELEMVRLLASKAVGKVTGTKEDFSKIIIKKGGEDENNIG